MSNSPLRHALMLASLVFLEGCAGTRRAEDALLARHPVHETRMSNHAQEGYVPAGVWRVRGIHNNVYLVGTSHIVAPDQIPFPSPYYAAYCDSQTIYVEFDTDLSWWAKLRLMPRMWKWVKTHNDVVATPKGKTLSDFLSPETLGQLRQRYGKDFSRERVTPVFLLFMNEAGVLEAKGEKPSGVEEPFQVLARRDGKPQRELDDGDAIDTALLALDQALLGYQREIAKRGADAVVREALVTSQGDEDAGWRHGDLAAVARMQEAMKKDSPTIYEKALPERNRKWMRKLEPLLHGEKSAMVLVGVAHLAGEDGLLNLLRAAGFPSEQMYGVDKPETTSVPHR